MSISTDVITSYKKIDEAYIDSLLEAEIKASNKKIVVLDDDPTGVQTVHDISVYTSWDKDSITRDLVRGKQSVLRAHQLQRIYGGADHKGAP